ncbi:MAG: MCE family protein, partial [Pedobacter sp.]
SIASTLGSLEATSKKVDALVGSDGSRISAIFANLENITGNLKGNNQKINDILLNINTVTDKFAAMNFQQTVDNANKAIADMQGAINKVNRGEGSLGKLINDDALYNNLANASKNLDLLMVDLKANPKRYVHFSVFGGNKDK